MCGQELVLLWRWSCGSSGGGVKEFSGKVSCTQLKTLVEKLSRMAEKVLRSLGWTLREGWFGLSAPDFFQVLAFVADWRVSMTATDSITRYMEVHTFFFLKEFDSIDFFVTLLKFEPSSFLRKNLVSYMPCQPDQLAMNSQRPRKRKENENWNEYYKENANHPRNPLPAPSQMSKKRPQVIKRTQSYTILPRDPNLNPNVQNAPNA